MLVVIQVICYFERNARNHPPLNLNVAYGCVRARCRKVSRAHWLRMRVTERAGCRMVSRSHVGATMVSRTLKQHRAMIKD